MNALLTMRSNFYRPTPLDPGAIKRRGYLDQGVPVLNVDYTRLNFIEREIIRRIVDRLYGSTKTRLNQANT